MRSFPCTLSPDVPCSLPVCVTLQAAVNDVVFSPSGDVIASASKDRTVRLWIPSVYVLLRFPFQQGPHCWWPPPLALIFSLSCIRVLDVNVRCLCVFV